MSKADLTPAHPRRQRFVILRFYSELLSDIPGWNLRGRIPNRKQQKQFLVRLIRPTKVGLV